MVLCAAATGVAGWSGVPLLLPLATAFPLLWGLAATRSTAGALSAAYFLAASRDLPVGVLTYFGTGDIWPSLALWLGASSGFTFVHTVLWTHRSGWTKATCYAAASVLMSIPPFGFVGWAHPITAAGILLPGWGWLGLALAWLALLILATERRRAVLPGFAALWLISAATWTPPAPPRGWIGIDTQFRGAEGSYAGYDQQLKTLELVRSAASSDVSMIVLPESALGIWTPTVERLWSNGLRGLDVTILAGAVVMLPDGYDNVILELSSREARVLYRQRMPVPVSMWQPWRDAVRDGSLGAHAYFFENPAVDAAGTRIAALLCYEQLLIWPVIQSMLWRPQAIVAVGNGWWTTGTAIVDIQRASSQAWARLFSVPVISAFNTYGAISARRG